MDLEQLRCILARARRKHPSRWHIRLEGEWEAEDLDGKSVWANGCVAVVMPPYVSRWKPEIEDYEDMSFQELYVYPDSTPQEVKAWIRSTSQHYAEYLADGWEPGY